jgi:hypothetical protein
MEKIMSNSSVRSRAVLVALAAIVLVVSNVSIKAQSLSIVVKVPFAFQAGDKTLPAGTYTVKRQGEAVRIRDTSGHDASVISNAITNRAKGVANELTFNHYGNTYFLSEVCWSDYSTARGLQKSPAEEKLAKGAKPESVKVPGTPGDDSTPAK